MNEYINYKNQQNNIINGINGISFKLEPYLREGVQQQSNGVSQRKKSDLNKNQQDSQKNSS